MTLSPSFHLDGGGGGGGVSSSTCSGATGAVAAGGGAGAAFGAAGGGAGAAASGSLERGAGRGPSSSSVVSPPAVGGFQLAGEAVWGESMFINAQKAANIRCLAQYRLCRNPDAM